MRGRPLAIDEPTEQPTRNDRARAIAAARAALRAGKKAVVFAGEVRNGRVPNAYEFMLERDVKLAEGEVFVAWGPHSFHATHNWPS